MGYLNERHGMTMPGNTPPGTCPECAVAHDPQQPHDWQSLAYQYKYYDRHGRWPTWADAMAHCSPEVKALWRDALKEHGIIAGEESQGEVREIEITIEVKRQEETQ
jgi:hypothetical protein